MSNKKESKKVKKVKKEVAPETTITEVPVFSEPSIAKEKTSGVLIAAFGHPYYSHMAHTLALSIKHQSPEVKIALVYKDNSLSQLDDGKRAEFDYILECPDDFIRHNGHLDTLKFKLHLNELTPFDRTLFLDADMIVSSQKKVSDLLYDLEGTKFQTQVRKRVNTTENIKSEWVSLSEVKTQYGFSEVYDLSSEVIYFEGADDIFNAAQKAYLTHSLSIKPFAGGLPDEVFFMLAVEQTGHEMKCPFTPSYWHPYYFNQFHRREEIENSHYFLSVGGAFIQKHIKKIYDSLAKHYSYRKGIQTPYQLIPKSRILPERRRI